jgi:transcriptional regulator GlxA family with amidase domain
VKRQISDSPDEVLVAKINLYATQHIASPFPLEELARLVGVSASHLRSRFHQITGRSLGRHLRELRMQHACTLLHDGRSSIGEIAQQCGFDSLFSFSRAFRNSIGCAPSAYRTLVSTAQNATAQMAGAD